jgi:hypothetical protein
VEYPLSIYFFKKSKIGHGGPTQNRILRRTTVIGFPKTFSLSTMAEYDRRPEYSAMYNMPRNFCVLRARSMLFLSTIGFASLQYTKFSYFFSFW